MSGSKIRLYGSTSGYVELEAPAVAPDGVLTLPSTFAGIGSNVVQTVKTDTFTTTSSTYVDITNLSATITPTLATSKVLVLLHAVVSNTNSNDSAFVRLLRDSTAVFVGDSAGNRVQATSGTYLGNVTNALEVGFSASASFVDSPATASAVTYKAQIRVAGGIGGTATVGRSGGDSDSAQRGRFPASLVVIEVAA